MSLESLTNRGEYLSAHYLAEVLPAELKKGQLTRWAATEEEGGRTPRGGVRTLRRAYFEIKAELADLAADETSKRRDKLHELHAAILTSLGFTAGSTELAAERAGKTYTIPVAYAGSGVVAIECGWAVDSDAALDPDTAGQLLDSVELDARERIDSGVRLASFLHALDDAPPRYVLILSGAVVTLADRTSWGEGRYLAVNLDTAFARNDTRPAGELDIIAALFSADALQPPAEGGAEAIIDLIAASRQHAVGVSSELRGGLRQSVELIANEVLDRIREAGYRPDQIMETAELADRLSREALRYLYRILFLLYAEARPELGVLPVDDRDYIEGYSLARLGNLVIRQLVGEESRRGFHLYESLDLLFRMVNEGHPPGGGPAPAGETMSEGAGIRFEPLKSDLFRHEAITLIGAIPPPDDIDGPCAVPVDTRLRNATLHRVLRLLMLTTGKKKQRGGFISYAQLGINQLGAVYEGLMSYSGFIAAEELFEVAKGGDPKDGSWTVPASRADNYPDEVFVTVENPETGASERVRHPAGSFVYRLAGRDRQTSASYYTPQTLTATTVQLALKYRLDQAGTTSARELLDWTICEPALGSGAFLNEAIDQIAAEYLHRRQEELGERLDPEQYHHELQKVKAYIALHNCYGVDLNRTAVELAEVSLWLNVMHSGLQAPWFGLHLRRGNSLIGARRQTYRPAQILDKTWLTTPPTDYPLSSGALPDGVLHHFLLPAQGWGAVAGEPEAKKLAPLDAKRLSDWRRAIRRPPSNKRQQGQKLTQLERLLALSRRVERLWELVRQRLEISEREIRRNITVWGADDLPPVTEAVTREKILADLHAPGAPYWRLKTLMDVWCALWFWPLDKADILDGSAAEYGATRVVTHVETTPVYEEDDSHDTETLFDLDQPEQLKLPLATRRVLGTRKATVIEQLTKQVPLAELGDWLTFVEAILGRQDIPADSLVGHFDDLDQLETYEDQLTGWTGMDSVNRLAERFPWLHTATDIAHEQGFFHWELEFAQAFSAGGFDIQVGNPPWVRPTWHEDLVLAERDPWFVLTENPSVETWQKRKQAAIAPYDFFARELAANSGYVAFYGSPATYPLLTGTQPDLYRAFMCRVWLNLSHTGAAGLIHPDTHFGGAHEGRLRAATYSHLRLHGHFQNMRLIFPELNWRQEFGIHVYGPPQGHISFTNLSWLYAPETLIGSLTHNGEGPVPGIKSAGTWDLRPHRARLIPVDETTLAEWRMVAGTPDLAVAQTKLLRLATAGEQGAIAALAKVSHRLGELHPMISRGFEEKAAKGNGTIAWQGSDPQDWREVVLQGPHFGVATPLAKQPNIPCRSNKDYEPWNLTTCDVDAIPRTNYRRVVERALYENSQDVWGGRRYTAYYRLAWRKMLSLSTERSLFAALIPPGPTHIDSVRSMALASNRDTALQAAFFASLPLDYLVRITGRGDLHIGDAAAMPAARPEHPLAPAALLRALRLNCLTNAYSALWEELYDVTWHGRESWAVEWDNLPEAVHLGDVGRGWCAEVPLRTERGRRAALVELDALVAVWLGISEAELLAMYRSRFPVLAEYESSMWFDRSGRRITGDYYARGVNQANDAYDQLLAHLDDPTRRTAPDGYSGPFYKADREGEYRQAHAVFTTRMIAAKDAGWTP